MKPIHVGGPGKGPPPAAAGLRPGVALAGGGSFCRLQTTSSNCLQIAAASQQGSAHAKFSSFIAYLHYE
jgi:hypothetical protein